MSYDAHQREAALTRCASCGRSWYVTRYAGGPYVCVACRRLRAIVGLSEPTPADSRGAGAPPRTFSREK